MIQKRKHQNKSIDQLINQMLHSQHKRSTNQSDGDTVEEWKDELMIRIKDLTILSEYLNKIIYDTYGCLCKDDMQVVIQLLSNTQNNFKNY